MARSFAIVDPYTKRVLWYYPKERHLWGSANERIAKPAVFKQRKWAERALDETLDKAKHGNYFSEYWRAVFILEVPHV